MYVRNRAAAHLLSLLPELYACRTLPEFLNAAVYLLAPLIPSDGCGFFCYAIGERPGLLMSAESEPVTTPQIVQRFGDTVRNHPNVELWSRTGQLSVLLFSDFPIRVRRNHLDEFRDIYRVIGREQLTVPVLFEPRRAVAVSWRRERGTFTEHDRAVATYLQPHLRQAFVNAETYSAARAATARPNEPLDATFTLRESEVGFWLVQGKTDREIGIILGISHRTAEKHVQSVLRKLNVEHRTAAALHLSRQMPQT